MTQTVEMARPHAMASFSFEFTEWADLSYETYRADANARAHAGDFGAALDYHATFDRLIAPGTCLHRFSDDNGCVLIWRDAAMASDPAAWKDVIHAAETGGDAEIHLTASLSVALRGHAVVLTMGAKDSAGYADDALETTIYPNRPALLAALMAGRDHFVAHDEYVCSLRERTVMEWLERDMAELMAGGAEEA